jgi:hypothetical protein
VHCRLDRTPRNPSSRAGSSRCTRSIRVPRVRAPVSRGVVRRGRTTAGEDRAILIDVPDMGRFRGSAYPASSGLGRTRRGGAEPGWAAGRPVCGCAVGARGLSEEGGWAGAPALPRSTCSTFRRTGLKEVERAGPPPGQQRPTQRLKDRGSGSRDPQMLQRSNAWNGRRTRPYEPAAPRRPRTR